MSEFPPPKATQFISWEWLARMLIGIATALVLYNVRDMNATIARTAEAVTDLKIQLAEKYIPRSEAAALVDAAENRLTRRIDREHPASRREP